MRSHRTRTDRGERGPGTPQPQPRRRQHRGQPLRPALSHPAARAALPPPTPALLRPRRLLPAAAAAAAASSAPGLQPAPASLGVAPCCECWRCEQVAEFGLCGLVLHVLRRSPVNGCRSSSGIAESSSPPTASPATWAVLDALHRTRPHEDRQGETVISLALLAFPPFDAAQHIVVLPCWLFWITPSSLNVP